MRHSNVIGIVAALIFTGLFLYPRISHAQIPSLPYSITFSGCTTMNESQYPPWPNSGTQDCIAGGALGPSGYTTGDGYGNYETITPDANFPSGGGGSGELHWIGPGKNRLSHMIIFNWGSPKAELWFRWYMKYEAGTRVNGPNSTNPATGDTSAFAHKLMYTNGDSATGNIIVYINYGTWEIVDEGVDMLDDGTCCANTNVHGWQDLTSNTATFPTMPASDGSWHCIEFHYKVQNPVGASNGVAQLWTDGIQRLNSSTLHYLSDGGGWSTTSITNNTDGMIGIPCPSPCSNGDNVNGYRAIKQYIDDVSISNTGRIGCFNLPNPPKSLTVQ